MNRYRTPTLLPISNLESSPPAITDTAHGDSVTSQAAIGNLNPLTESFQTIFRGELGLVRDVVEQSVRAVKHLASAVRETQLEMSGLKALVDAMSEKPTNTPGYTAAAASSIDTTSATEMETDGATDPAPTDATPERYLAHTNA